MEKDTTSGEQASYKNTLENESSSLSSVSFSPLIKKSERISAALYLITECFGEDDALRSEIRSRSIELLKGSSRMSVLPIGARTHVSAEFINHGSFILSLLSIAHIAGFVSEMNLSILKKEITALQILAKDLSSPSQIVFPRSRAGTEEFSFGQNFFSSGSNDARLASSPINQTDVQKDNSSLKNIPHQSQVHSRIHSGTQSSKRTPLVENKGQAKDDRRGSIVSIIKKMGTASIKDVSIHFKEISEKTIQRELTTLVENGTLKRQGDKRWSRYEIK